MTEGGKEGGQREEKKDDRGRKRRMTEGGKEG